MNNARFFTSSQRNEIFLNSGGKCQSCGAEISLENFHADHIIPFSEGGITEIKNGQALCQKCNLAKGAKLKVDLSPWMPPGFEARGWQQDFWERAFRSIIQQVDLPPSEIQAFMLHAFPGAGKTLAALLLAQLLIARGYIEKVIICVPTDYLRDQMEEEAQLVGLHLNNKKLYSLGFGGIVTTYAKIGSRAHDTGAMINSELLRRECNTYKTLVVADECHHLAEESNWGESFLNAFDGSVARLITSGTPFRTDGQRLPWARYYRRQIDLSPPHAYSYGYGFSKWNTSYCALADRVVRDVVIHSWDWEVDFTLTEKDWTGAIVSQQNYRHKISDNIDELYPCEFDEETNRRIVDNRILRRRIKSGRRKGLLECGTEKYPHGTEYVKQQLIEANIQLDKCRKFHPWAGGLIICDDIEHADNIAKALKHHTKEEAVVIHSDAPNDKRALKAYKKDKTQSRAKWIIAVGKISEGVDIKFLRVCVYMTSITAALRWTQIIGRVLRTEKEIDWEQQTAHFYQYEDGMELVTDENGNVTPESTSANIKLYAETLNEERNLLKEIQERERTNTPGSGGFGNNINISVETQSVTNGINQQIYDGQRFDNSEIEPYGPATARTGIPEIKLANIVNKCGPDELIKMILKAKNKVNSNNFNK